MTEIGLILFILNFLLFINRLGKSWCILESLCLIAGAQWIIGPFIAYQVEIEHVRYGMRVSELEYMSFLVPCYAIMLAISYSFRKQNNLPSINLLEKHSNHAKLFTIIGISAFVLQPFLPNSLNFLAYLLFQFLYVAGLMWYLNNERGIWILISILGLLFFRSLQLGMFGDFVLWSLFYFAFYCLKTQINISKKMAIIVSGSLLLFTIQIAKPYIRGKSNFYGTEPLEIFSNILLSKVLGEDDIQEDETEISQVRLNQGWIIASIMDHIPRNKDFLQGTSIMDAINSSIMPRFLYENKMKAGGRENFRLFTGQPIRENTSMGISVVGESYGNFGRFYGIVFMGGYLMFLVLVLKLLYNTSIRYPYFYFLLPLVFLQVIKAETELYVVLNHLLKSLLVVYLFHFFIVKKLGTSEN
jgi:hypothetical protein